MADAVLAEELSSQDVQRRIANNDSLFLIDVLPAEHFAAVHLPRAANACVYEVTFLHQIEEITSDRDAAIVVYGAGGATRDAAVAADKLRRAGYRNIALLRGGLDAWRSDGLPLEGADPATFEDLHAAVRLTDGDYRIDVDKSLIVWTGRNPNGSHNGTVKLTEGTIRIAGEQVTGRFVIDMTSIENTDLAGDPLQPVLIAHLNSDDFFFTQLFPKAIFELREARLADEPLLSTPNVTVEGSLELRGLRVALGFPATVALAPDGDLVAEAHFDIDRTRWGVIYGSTRFFAHLGMHLVFDPISLQVRIVAR